MLIRNFGLFWRAEEIDWSPGPGHRWRMLGRVGWNNPGLQVADFRDQRGLYVLYGNYGPHYVGLARDRGIGDRLKDHRKDHHRGEWDRFSWFGFRRILTSRDSSTGLVRLAATKSTATGELNDVIADMEALLIRALGCSDNYNQMKFPRGDEWEQVTRYDREVALLDRGDVSL